MKTALLETTPKEVAHELTLYHVVDVREASEFEGPLGHLADAQWISLSQLEGRVGELPIDKPLLMVCRSGKRSAMACARLAESGRPGAINLTGGMIAWHANGLPVVRSRFRNPRAILEAFAVWLSQVTQTPLDDVTARVRDAKKAEVAADDSASPSDVTARTLARIEREFRMTPNVPADLGLVCAALLGDAKALDSRAEVASEELSDPAPDGTGSK